MPLVAGDLGVAVIKPSSPEMPAPADRGPRHQLFGEIARGGMGAVLKGRDPDLGRDLASIRDPAALAGLPEDERSACRKLWSEVDAWLAKARGAGPAKAG